MPEKKFFRTVSNKENQSVNDSGAGKTERRPPTKNVKGNTKMTINNAVLKNCLKLSSKITVYVPATNGIDQAADNTEQVKKTAALLSELFGGATSTPALGYWMSPAAGLVAEATTVVFAYAADAALQEHVGRVVELCEELKREMGQEAIALEINGEMYFI